MNKIKRTYYLVFKTGSTEPISSRVVTENAGMFGRAYEEVLKSIGEGEKLVRTTLKEWRRYNFPSHVRIIIRSESS